MWFWVWDNIEKWAKNNIWSQMEHPGPCRFASNCVCMNKKNTFYKIT